MSDEPPPQLRLRPRVRPEEPASPTPALTPSTTPPSSPTPAFIPALIPAPTIPPSEPTRSSSAAASSNAEDTIPRLRLKPKLTTEPEATTVVTGASPSSAASAPPAPVSEDSSLPRLKLKALTPAATGPSAIIPPAATIPPSTIPAIIPATVPAVAPAPADLPHAYVPSSGRISDLKLPPTISPSMLIGALPPLTMPKLVEAPLQASLTVPPPLPPISTPPVAKGKPLLHLSLKPAGGKTRLRSSSARPPVSKTRIAVVVSAGVVLLMGAASFGYIMWGSPGELETKTVNAPPAKVSTPATPGSPATKVVVTPPTPSPGLEPLPPLSAFEPVKKPGSSAAKASSAAILAATAALRTWSDNAKITSVLSSASPRAIINGRLVRPGDMVDATEGITLDSIDTTAKQMVFRNRTGQSVTKAY